MEGNQSNQKKKNNFNWIFLIFTFFVAVSGSFFVQTYLARIIGSEEINSVEKLSIESEVNGMELVEENNQEKVIEQAMKSVVGISKLQASEESILDVALSQKWGLRHRSYCI